jgi:hypothetical protein
MTLSQTVPTTITDEEADQVARANDTGLTPEGRWRCFQRLLDGLEDRRAATSQFTSLRWPRCPRRLRAATRDRPVRTPDSCSRSGS